MGIIAGLLGGILTALIGIHIVLRDIEALLKDKYRAESGDKECHTV